MGLVWEQVVIEARDPVALGRWWAAALGWVVVEDDPAEFEIRPAPDALPGILFETVDHTKQGKNRLHLDLRPDDQEAEVTRLLAAGATRVDIGQGDVTWVVMADPEGNEFCVLRAPTTDPTAAERSARAPRHRRPDAQDGSRDAPATRFLDPDRLTR